MVFGLDQYCFLEDLNLLLPTQLPTSFECRMRFTTAAIESVVFTRNVFLQHASQTGA